MNKTKIITYCLFVPFLILLTLNFLKFKKLEEFKQKTVLAQEIRKVLDHLMIDLSEARESTILDLPADGQWHGRIAFEDTNHKSLEYLIKDGHLLRISNGKMMFIADNISMLRIRRQKEDHDILEIQIEAQNKASLLSNLKIRVRQ